MEKIKEENLSKREEIVIKTTNTKIGIEINSD